MKYYRHESEDIKRGEGVAYLEVDERQDLVTRQVEVYGDVYLWGKWTGSRLEGSICDQEPSTLGLTHNDAIAASDFEAVWEKAIRQ